MTGSTDWHKRLTTSLGADLLTRDFEGAPGQLSTKALVSSNAPLFDEFSTKQSGVSVQKGVQTTVAHTATVNAAVGLAHLTTRGTASRASTKWKWEPLESNKHQTQGLLVRRHLVNGRVRPR